MTAFAYVDHVPFVTGGQFVVEPIEDESLAFFTDGQFGIKTVAAPIRRPAVSFSGGSSTGGGAWLPRVPISQPLLWEEEQCRPWETEEQCRARGWGRREPWENEQEPAYWPPPIYLPAVPLGSSPAPASLDWRSVALGVSIGVLAGIVIYKVYSSWQKKSRRKRAPRRRRRSR